MNNTKITLMTYYNGYCRLCSDLLYVYTMMVLDLQHAGLQQLSVMAMASFSIFQKGLYFSFLEKVLANDYVYRQIQCRVLPCFYGLLTACCSTDPDFGLY